MMTMQILIPILVISILQNPNEGLILSDFGQNVTKPTKTDSSETTTKATVETAEKIQNISDSIQAAISSQVTKKPMENISDAKTIENKTDIAKQTTYEFFTRSIANVRDTLKSSVPVYVSQSQKDNLWSTNLVRQTDLSTSTYQAKEESKTTLSYIYGSTLQTNIDRNGTSEITNSLQNNEKPLSSTNLITEKIDFSTTKIASKETTSTDISKDLPIEKVNKVSSIEFNKTRNHRVKLTDLAQVLKYKIDSESSNEVTKSLISNTRQDVTIDIKENNSYDKNQYHTSEFIGTSSTMSSNLPTFISSIRDLFSNSKAGHVTENIRLTPDSYETTGTINSNEKSIKSIEKMSTNNWNENKYLTKHLPDTASSILTVEPLSTLSKFTNNIYSKGQSTKSMATKEFTDTLSTTPSNMATSTSRIIDSEAISTVTHVTKNIIPLSTSNAVTGDERPMKSMETKTTNVWKTNKYHTMEINDKTSSSTNNLAITISSVKKLNSLLPNTHVTKNSRPSFIELNFANEKPKKSIIIMEGNKSLTTDKPDTIINYKINSSMAIEKSIEYEKKVLTEELLTKASITVNASSTIRNNTTTSSLTLDVTKRPVRSLRMSTIKRLFSLLSKKIDEGIYKKTTDSKFKETIKSNPPVDREVTNENVNKKKPLKENDYRSENNKKNYDTDTIVMAKAIDGSDDRKSNFKSMMVDTLKQTATRNNVSMTPPIIVTKKEDTPTTGKPLPTGKVWRIELQPHFTMNPEWEIPAATLEKTTKVRPTTRRLLNKMVKTKNIPSSVTTSGQEIKISRSSSPWLSRELSQPPNLFHAVCTLDVSEGTGSETFSSWFYNEVTRRCEWFSYRGEEGNGNRFNYRGNCENYCIGNQQDLCLRSDLVNCEERWLHCKMITDQYCYAESEKSNKLPILFCPPEQPICVSKNNIFRRPPLYLTHRSMIPNECLQMKDPGLCHRNSNSVLLFYYDHRYNDCYGFLYSKCGGNSNRFATKEECMNHCAF